MTECPAGAIVQGFEKRQGHKLIAELQASACNDDTEEFPDRPMAFPAFFVEGHA
ncbi:MAG: hypothetical protein HKN42_18395 [Granulosicoccus sp.]|nr:hypothetical protein [Granulosicoccus sp.]